MRTFQQLQEAVRLEMQLDPGLISTTERKQFLNDALSDLGDVPHLEKDLQVAISATGQITLPTGFTQIVALLYNDKPLSVAGYDSIKVTTGTPMYFVLTPSYIQVIPNPSTGLARLVHEYRPAAMDADTDTPDIPEGWDWLLVDYGVGRAHRKNGNLGIYREYMNSYGIGKMRLAEELLKRFNSRVNIERNQEFITTPHPFQKYSLV